MVNSFDTDVAMVVGVVPAVIYQNIAYWCEKNRTNNQNEFDGLYWSYNSITAFCEQFPYLTRNQINTAINKLVDAGFIKKGNFNKASYDRTTWYADLQPLKNQKCIYEKSEMDLRKNQNGIVENQKPIPDINTNNKPNINIVSKKESFDDILNLVNGITDELKDAYLEFIKMRKLIKKPLTNYALKNIIKKVDEYSNGDIQIMIAILNQSIVNSWQGVFPLKNPTPSAPKTKISVPDGDDDDFKLPFEV